MDVLHLLFHHFITLDLLGVASFLPQLKLTVRFVPCLFPCELVEQGPFTTGLEPVDDLPRGERFELGDLGRKQRAPGNQVEVIFHHDISEQHPSARLVHVGQRIENELGTLPSGEDW